MKIKTFIRKGWQLIPAEVELTLVPGLPEIQFIGLPDRIIRESTLRIKSALKNQKFVFPRAKQTIVHLKPSYLKKTSYGLDLAVIVALLCESKQIKIDENLLKNVYFYGEVSLTGIISAPEDIEDILDNSCINNNFKNIDLNDKNIKNGDPKNKEENSSEFYVVTGKRDIYNYNKFIFYNELKELYNFHLNFSYGKFFTFDPPKVDRKLFLTKQQAKILKIIAVGEHSCCFIGPPGSGKTTLAKLVHLLLRPVNRKIFKQSRIISKFFGIDLLWRPLVIPHHSISALAMIGGGNVPKPGEISRSHGGLLILDELLEFNPKVQEALREPFEAGKISITRNSQFEIFPAQSLIIATTNLCPCGKWLPGKNEKCRCSINRLRTYLNKLSGPLLDRFQLLFFMFEDYDHQQEKVSLQEVFIDIKKIINFILNNRLQFFPNNNLSIDLLEKDAEKFLLKKIFPSNFKSFRRKKSFLQVARTIADIDFSLKIQVHHLQESLKYTVNFFNDIENISL